MVESYSRMWLILHREEIERVMFSKGVAENVEWTFSEL